MHPTTSSHQDSSSCNTFTSSLILRPVSCWSNAQDEIFNPLHSHLDAVSLRMIFSRWPNSDLHDSCNTNLTILGLLNFLKIPSWHMLAVLLHCVSKKRHPFYICYNLIKCHPILSILGRNILREIWNKHKCTENHISFRVFMLYRVKSNNDFYGMQ